MRVSCYGARGKSGEHEKSVRVVRGAVQSNSSFLRLYKFPKTDKPPTDHAKPDFDLFLHIDASRVVWTLTNNDRLANQIAKLVAIILKRSRDF